MDTVLGLTLVLSLFLTWHIICCWRELSSLRTHEIDLRNEIETHQRSIREWRTVVETRNEIINDLRRLIRQKDKKSSKPKKSRKKKDPPDQSDSLDRFSKLE